MRIQVEATTSMQTAAAMMVMLDGDNATMAQAQDATTDRTLVRNLALRRGYNVSVRMRMLTI